jgi:hypothetical protein
MGAIAGPVYTWAAADQAIIPCRAEDPGQGGPPGIVDHM